MAGGMRGSDPGAGSVGQHLPQRGVRPAAGERLEQTRPLRGTLRRADRGRPTLVIGKLRYTARSQLFRNARCLLRVGYSKSRRQWRPDRAVTNNVLSGPWVRTVAAYAGVATVSPAVSLQAQNGAAGHDRACGANSQIAVT